MKLIEEKIIDALIQHSICYLNLKKGIIEKLNRGFRQIDIKDKVMQKQLD